MGTPFPCPTAVADAKGRRALLAVGQGQLSAVLRWDFVPGGEPPARGRCAPVGRAQRPTDAAAETPTEKSPTGTFLALPALFSQELKVVGLRPTPCKLFVKSLTKNFSFCSTAPG